VNPETTDSEREPFIKATNLRHPRYCVMVYQFLLGQWRIMLCDKGAPDEGGLPGIVREMCTYDADRMTATVVRLAQSTDPEALCNSWAKPWNCEGHGGRIRLDTTEQDNPYRGRVA
jgi:hypothetical protein